MIDNWWQESKAHWASGYGSRKEVKHYCQALREAGLSYKVSRKEIRMPVQELWQAMDVLILAGDEVALSQLPVVEQMAKSGELVAEAGVRDG